MSLDQWSQTPASNDLANYFQTGMAPSKVKNAGWDVMADACAVIGTGSVPTSGGTANAQTITNTRAYGAWFTGMWVVWNPSATNTGAMTIQPDGLAAKNVFANGAAALAGQVVSGVIAVGRYDGTQVQLVNPQRSTGSFTGTLNGMSATTTGTLNYAVEPSGKLASMWAAAAITGTSNATTMSLLNVPSILQPVTTKRIPQPLEDSGGAIQTAVIFPTASSTFNLNGGANIGGSSSGGFTATGTKGIPAFWSVQYGLD